MRYRLRTLLIVLALGPMVLAGVWLTVIAVREYTESVGRRIKLEHQGMFDESRRIDKGQPTFTDP